ncbi:uncharacterized protein [Triticum aestivum]|uniref:uncharacterized protein n=1 Tax=Triticum aestivum TaxID=4565 RepID=UPI001D02CE54|nr:uncharacterized protein LOC123174227 [Triticum aestivum]
MANNSSWCTKDPACGVHVEFFFTLKHRLWSWSQFSSDGLGLKLLDEAQTCYYLARLWSSVHVVAGLLPVTSTKPVRTLSALQLHAGAEQHLVLIWGVAEKVLHALCSKQGLS